MRRALVDSASIASIGYDPRRRELEVEFRDTGDVYRYFGVSAAEYSDLMAAESKGTYLNQEFKPRAHHYFVVKEGKRLAPGD
jgi:KTSC domain